MDSIHQDVAHAMWSDLRHDIIQQWRHETGADPDVSDFQVTVYSFHGALEVRFCPDTGRVRLVLRCYEDEHGRGEETAEYQMTVGPHGERCWQRGSFRHGQVGMGRLMIYHLLKYRAPPGVFVVVER